MVNSLGYARPVWVVFSKRTDTVWPFIQKFTTEEFNHVYCIIETIGGIMRIDGSMAGITFHEFPMTWLEYLEANAHTITDCIRVDVDRGQYWKTWRGIYTCVTTVKAICLLKTPWWVITPKQLYGWLYDKSFRSISKHAEPIGNDSSSEGASCCG